MKTTIRRWGIIGAIALLSMPLAGMAQEVAKKAAPKAAPTPESLIGNTSAIERTTPFPVGEKTLYFVNLRDGDKIRSPFRVAFAISGMGVSPVKAGAIEGTGHHHILIDLALPPDIKAPVPFDTPGEIKNQHYKHFGAGETETILDLPPGKHKLRLVFADHTHVPYYIASKEINIEVLATNKSETKK